MLDVPVGLSARLRAPRRKKKDGPVPVTGRTAGAAAASMPNAMPWRRIPFWTTELDRAVRQSSSQCSRARSPARNLPICPIRQADGSTVADPPAGTDNSRKARSSPQLCRQRQTQGPPWLAGPGMYVVLCRQDSAQDCPAGNELSDDLLQNAPDVIERARAAGGGDLNPARLPKCASGCYCISVRIYASCISISIYRSQISWRGAAVLHTVHSFPSLLIGLAIRPSYTSGRKMITFSRNDNKYITAPMGPSGVVGCPQLISS
jgi:hypothetical protein